METELGELNSRAVEPADRGQTGPAVHSSGSAVGKALDLIEAAARSPDGLRLSELAEQVGLHRSTAYRVLADLVRRNWVLRYNGRYLPGTVLLQVSQQVSARSIAAICRPVLESLAARTDMMSNLQVLEPDGARVIDAVRPQRYSVISHLVGELLPAHRFAGPLALVAALSPQRRAHYTQRAAEDGHPLDGPHGLLEEIAEARRTGFALVRRREDNVVASVSRVVPSLAEDPLCALTVVGLDTEFEPDRLRHIQQELGAAVNEVEALLDRPVLGESLGSEDTSDEGTDS